MDSDEGRKTVPKRSMIEFMENGRHRDIAAKADSSGMIDVLDSFGAQCRDAVARSEGFAVPEFEVDKIVVCGMGGSAMAGEIARRFARIPLIVNRSYDLPEYVDRHTLLVAISYSGNTAETLSSLEQGSGRNAPTIAISSGGKLGEISETRGIPLLRVPSGYQPRAALGHLAVPLLAVLSRLDLLKEIGPWDSPLQAIDHVRNRCTAAVPTEVNPAKRLARTLNGRIPVIYGTVDNTDLVAMRWKTQINENAKQPAFWNVFPELNHNEILALVKADLFEDQFLILLKNDYDRRENLDRMRIMTDLLAEKAVRFTEVTAEGECEIAQILTQIYFGDYVSYYLALLNEVDPTPVALIEAFKCALAELDQQRGDRQ